MNIWLQHHMFNKLQNLRSFYGHYFWFGNGIACSGLLNRKIKKRSFPLMQNHQFSVGWLISENEERMKWEYESLEIVKSCTCTDKYILHVFKSSWLPPAEMEGDPAPGHVCWHDLNMCVRVLETAAWQLIYISNGTWWRSREREEERQRRGCLMCGLDVALPCRAKGLAAGRLVPVGYRADFSWWKRSRGWTEWWLDTKGAFANVTVFWSEYREHRGGKTPSGQHRQTRLFFLINRTVPIY